MSEPVLSVTDSVEWDRVRAVIAANVYVEHDRRERAQIVTEALLGPRPADPPPRWRGRDDHTSLLLVEANGCPGHPGTVYVGVTDNDRDRSQARLSPAKAREFAAALVACADWIDNNRSET